MIYLALALFIATMFSTSTFIFVAFTLPHFISKCLKVAAPLALAYAYLFMI